MSVEEHWALCKGNSAACVRAIMPCMVLHVAAVFNDCCYLTNDFNASGQIMLDGRNVSGVFIITYILRCPGVTLMSQRRQTSPKAETLQRQRTLNPHPERVVDDLFQGNDFFDPRDLLQVKYEMLRTVHVEGRSVRHSADAFGFSRPSFYKAQAAFEKDGLPGLIPQRRGPRQAHKIRGEVLDFLRQTTGEDPSLHGRALARLVAERFGLQVHPRSIERALARGGKKRP